MAATPEEGAEHESAAEAAPLDMIQRTEGSAEGLKVRLMLHAKLSSRHGACSMMTDREMACMQVPHCD